MSKLNVDELNEILEQCPLNANPTLKEVEDYVENILKHRIIYYMMGDKLSSRVMKNEVIAINKTLQDEGNTKGIIYELLGCVYHVLQGRTKVNRNIQDINPLAARLIHNKTV